MVPQENQATQERLVSLELLDHEDPQETEDLSVCLVHLALSA